MKPMTHLIIDTSSSDEFNNAECDYVLVELTPEYVVGLLDYMDRVTQMHRTDKSIYCLKVWDYSPSYFNSTEKFEDLHDVYGNLAPEVPQGEPILLAADPKLPENCFQRVECQLVKITTDDVSWACYPKHTNLQIASSTVDKKTLLEIQRRFGVRGSRRQHDKRRTVHPVIQRLHDLLYLDELNGRQFFNAEKNWDADTISAIAEVVAEYIPRPDSTAQAKEIKNG